MSAATAPATSKRERTKRANRDAILAAAISAVSCGGSRPAAIPSSRSSRNSAIPAPSAGSSNSVRIVPALRLLSRTVCGSSAMKAK